ncbi:MAG: aminoacyl-tRNA hydrolase [Candidatus Omnitrophica bacterium CG11_big_fil_rev_8_21_14_0_20_45_26]|uniref:Peptidyl-tRNA hydrolase n=1 Tax=Candidatus Abzuiibacterium crystallinum TaxID=1974748 RepID=A0A2H0LSG4_9BACT|nr:MAG: aminoacyl-tRNA hydrolase [Candidatus Omnitrophica bacterium CG11_big_fil_rev_8_21_14_0_20_45_26]PIW63409.1 MAG: aminoacyl-tRNA hydrolase [Candidatus Omnitrophica bacterium CG12_big_fil_rev_8_21_14_0_65_45_16]
MKIMVGLGNPGRRYLHTRHNIGFMVLDRLADDVKARFKSQRLFEYAQFNLEGESYVLIKPTTYMNKSGEAIQAFLAAHSECSAADLLVVSDDVNLPLGAKRLRAQGSSGGHRGLESVIEHLGTQAFARLRLGVGLAGDGQVLEEHVLDSFTKAEEVHCRTLVEAAKDICLDWAKEGIEAAMNRHNGPSAS